jgi:hypothetical protein
MVGKARNHETSETGQGVFRSAHEAGFVSDATSISYGVTINPNVSWMPFVNCATPSVSLSYLSYIQPNQDCFRWR